MSKYTDKHTVYNNSNGNEIPSVTTILKLLNKPVLVHWANYLGFKRQKVKDVLTTSANKGTEFHNLVHLFTTTGEVDLTNVSKEVLYLYNLYQVWHKANNFTLEFGEISLTSDLFGGTIDAIGTLNGNLIILDYKTSKSIYPSMFLQLAAYSILVEKNMPDLYKELKGVGILSISEKNGIQEKYITKEKIEEIYIPAFNALVDLFYKWYNINIDEWDTNITKE